MKITFLRHGSLSKPFDDYNKLSLLELSQLAMQKVDPLVDLSKINIGLSTKDYLLKKYDVLYVSESQRTSDTAFELSKMISLPPKIKLQELNEIVFDPSKLVTEKEYEKEKLTVIRRRLLEALANNSNIETGDKVLQRIKKLGKILKKNQADAILVITHGFFMRYLDIFYRQKLQDFSEDALNQAINYDYASGFTVLVD
ncbi:MAG: phosphoglycerate mutase family protein [Bacteriovoracaceae bacterium]